MKIGFDNEKYLKLQKEKILERIKMFENKLYLEMGGKLFDDLHASRILPGFKSDIKMQLLATLKDKAEIIICISANDIEKNRIRADLGLSYVNEVLRLIDNFRSRGLLVSSIVITLYKNQSSAQKFGNMLERRGENVYFHRYTKGYPSDVETIVSDEGYGANPYIKTTRPLVIVTAPGPSSGKLGTCLSQLYHEYKHGIKAGYAKFETFPVWNLPLKHPVNVAYEAATADIKDINMIDSYHFSKYKTLAVNYNRDLEVFPVLKNIIKKIVKHDIYYSPTDMGVNMVGYAICDDEVCREASKQEILRRYYRYYCDYKKGNTTFDTVDRVEMLLSELEIPKDYLPVIPFAKKISKASGLPTIAIELPDKTLVAGKTKNIISAAGAVVLNAIKTMAKIDDGVTLISDQILKPILDLKTKVLGSSSSVLSLDDVLIALSICANTDENAKKCMKKLKDLKSLNAHSTFILSASDENTMRKLGINLTCEPHFENNNLFI